MWITSVVSFYLKCHGAALLRCQFGSFESKSRSQFSKTLTLSYGSVTVVSCGIDSTAGCCVEPLDLAQPSSATLCAGLLTMSTVMR